MGIVASSVGGCFCGREGTRTPDLTDVNRTAVTNTTPDLTADQPPHHHSNKKATIIAPL